MQDIGIHIQRRQKLCSRNSKFRAFQPSSDSHNSHSHRDICTYFKLTPNRSTEWMCCSSHHSRAVSSQSSLQKNTIVSLKPMHFSHVRATICTHMLIKQNIKIWWSVFTGTIIIVCSENVTPKLHVRRWHLFRICMVIMSDDWFVQYGRDQREQRKCIILLVFAFKHFPVKNTKFMTMNEIIVNFVNRDGVRNALQFSKWCVLTWPNIGVGPGYVTNSHFQFTSSPTRLVASPDVAHWHSKTTRASSSTKELEVPWAIAGTRSNTAVNYWQQMTIAEGKATVVLYFDTNHEVKFPKRISIEDRLLQAVQRTHCVPVRLISVCQVSLCLSSA